MAQWWDDYKETELSWTDWKQESKKLRTEGLNKEEIFKKIGVPTKDGQVIKVTSDGAGGYKPRTGQRAQQASRRTTRIGTSKQEVNKSIRIEATKQWDELVGDRDTTIKIGNRNYTFDQYLNKEVRDHTKLTKQKAVEAVDLGKSLGHGTPTTDVGRYAESYTQQFAEDPLSNFASQDYIPPDQAERLRQAGLAGSPQEAAQLHVGTAKIGGRLPDPEIENLLKFSGGTVKFKAGSVVPLIGLAAGVIGAGQAFAAGDAKEGTARLLEAGAGEIPIAGDVVQPEAVAGGTFEDVERRTAEGLRARELQQRAAEARQRGGKLSILNSFYKHCGVSLISHHQPVLNTPLLTTYNTVLNDYRSKHSEESVRAGLLERLCCGHSLTTQKRRS
jgi:hypothetical protein